jgi:hypothetical protein
MSAKNIESFLLKISKDLNIDGKKLVEEWEEYSKPEIKKTYNKCIYEFVRAPHTGKKCGASIRKDDSVYCSKHTFSKKNTEKDIPDQPIPVPILIPVPDPVKDPPQPKKIAIRLHPELNKFVHTASSLVFFSKNEQVVYGKVIDGVIKDLSDEDIETCKKYQFKYDKSKLNLNKNE